MADSPEQARVRAMLRARGEQLAPRVGPETDYVYVEPKGSSSRNGSTTSTGKSYDQRLDDELLRRRVRRAADAAEAGPPTRWGQVHGWADRIQQAPVVSTPNHIPRWLGARPILFGAWGVAMLALSADDWFNNGILPRPSRLWQGSLLYGMLALLSLSDAMVPIANALGIGFSIVILWELFGGQFVSQVS